MNERSSGSVFASSKRSCVESKHSAIGLWLIMLITLSTVVFRSFPQLDIGISHLFFENGEFPLGENFLARRFRSASVTVTKIAVLILVALWILRFIPACPKMLVYPWKRLAFPTLALAMGPGLLTNLVLKNNWGRPRPYHLEIFGGQNTFVLPWTLSEQCPGNCSFVSGETSSAMWLLLLIPLLPQIWQNRLLWVGIVYIFVVSFLRIGFGAHFLSDVIFSVLLNGLVFWFLWRLFFNEDRIFKQSPSSPFQE